MLEFSPFLNVTIIDLIFPKQKIFDVIIGNGIIIWMPIDFKLKGESSLNFNINQSAKLQSQTSETL